MSKKAPGPAAVRVYPLPVAPIDGVPHKVMDVDAETAARLCAPVSRNVDWSVFTDDAAALPAWYSPPDPDGLMPPPVAEGPATQPTADDPATPSED